MNSKELYKETFSKLHASKELDLEDIKMKNRRTHFRFSKKLVVITAAMVIIMAMTCIANAATGGQLMEDIKIWINGEEIQGTMYQQEDGVIIELKKGDNVKTKSEYNDSEFNQENGSSTLKIDNNGEAEIRIHSVE